MLERDEALAAWQAMSEREHTIRIAEDVFKHVVFADMMKRHDLYWENTADEQGPAWELREYTTDHAAAYAVEERIQEMGLAREYAAEMWDMAGQVHDWLWKMLHASPEQRCCAAWVTVKMREGSV